MKGACVPFPHRNTHLELPDGLEASLWGLLLTEEVARGRLMVVLVS
jgi:hypothetical protein